MSEETTTNRKGDYEVLGVLGAGGMGQVFKVRNVLSGRVEAMKVLLPDLSNQKDLADRFLKEIRVLAGLHHPNIAELRTALTMDNQLVMIMEYVEGITLGARLQQSPIPYVDAAKFADQVLAALSYAHRQQIVHRDIKPANMMLTPEQEVKLMDFGIARSGTDRGLTMTGTTLGSVAYMSPEQVRCEPIDARSDLYSVGVSLYEMVTGRKPFEGENHFAVMKAHLEETPAAPDQLNPLVPHALSSLIQMAMAKDPAQRFQSADAFRGALHAVVPELGPFVAGVDGGLAGAAASLAAASIVAPAASIAPAAARGGSVAALPPTVPMLAVPSSAPPAGARASGSHRGLYITLGALIVVVVLVAAGIAVPRWQQTRASGDSFFHWKKAVATPSGNPTAGAASPVANSTRRPADVLPSSPAAPITASPSAQPSVTPAGAASSPVMQPHAAAISKNSPAAPGGAASQTDATRAQADADAAAQAAAKAQENAAQLQTAQHDFDLLSSRVAAVTSSLGTLERQQQSQGYGLRGDIAGSRSRMVTYMAKAENAVQVGDPVTAKKYMDLAEPEVEKLEKFLGR
jgi:serine/threonine-protein kinase